MEKNKIYGFYYRPKGEIHPLKVKAYTENEARQFFRMWANTKRLTGELWRSEA